jgi:hypothetical protein
MKAQRQNHKSSVSAILNLVDPDKFVPMHLSSKALSDDSCWDEYDAEYDESFSSNVLACFEDHDFE